MEKKQTAVQWFNQQLIDRQNGNGDSRSWDEILQQALQMEREQIIDAANKLLYHSTGPSDTAAKQYYNETYGGNNE
jgi:hypothetical protein